MGTRGGFLILLLVLISPPTGAETVVVFGDDSYAPVISLQGGKPSGLLVRTLEWVSNRTGDVYELRLYPWQRSYSQAESAAGGIVGLSWTQKRAEVFEYSDPLYDDNIQVVMAEGRTFPFQRLADLKGKVIGGQIGASYGQEVDAAIASGLFTVDRDNSEVARLKKLLAGRLDAAFIGNGTLGLNSILGRDTDLASNSRRLVVARHPLTVDELHLAFAKSMNMGPLLLRFNRALAELRRTPDWQRMLDAQLASVNR